MTTLTCFISKFLDTDDLDKQARHDPVLKHYYRGCFPADVKPDLKEKCCWIWNTDEQDEPGTHWVCVIKNNTNIIFFDSYGKSPTFFKRQYWRDYFQALGCTLTLNSTRQYQAHVSRTCGAWCLMFLKAYYSHQRDIMTQMFTTDPQLLMNNEQLLQRMVFHAYSTLQDVYRRKCIKSKGQICKSYLETYNKT